MRSSVTTFRQYQLDMRDPPLIAKSAPLRCRTDTLHARAVVGDGALHVQIIELDIEILFGAQKVRVVQRRLQQLAHVRGDALLGKQQRVAGFFHAAALDQIQHQARLLGRHSQVTHFGSKFHSRPPYAFGAAGEGAPGPPGTPAGLAATSVAARIEWPLKLRVKLNSPSLCPTMFSVRFTGINFLPLCTAMVWPTISGTMVERRDQVRRTFFSLREFMPSTRDIR